MGQKAAVEVRGVSTCMGAHFFERDLGQFAGKVRDLGQPGAKAEKPHAATFEAAGPKGHGARGDCAFT